MKYCKVLIKTLIRNHKYRNDPNDPIDVKHKSTS